MTDLDGYLTGPCSSCLFKMGHGRVVQFDTDRALQVRDHRQTMFNGSMRKRLSEVVQDNTRAAAPVHGDGWLGFVCKECGAPLSVHRSTTGPKAVERSTRGWRVACTGCGV